VATSASRDVANTDEFFAGITERLGVVPEVISGTEEARLSFAGALSGAADPPGPVLVADIGGGSTELIIGDGQGVVDHAASLDIGSVRLTERFFTADPPTADDLVRATAHIDRLLDDQQLEQVGIHTWIGVAGTLTTLAAIDLELITYDRDKVHGHALATADLTAIADRLSRSTADQIREIPGVHPKRADVITAGAVIATRIAARLPVDRLIVSESDILDGAALQAIASTRAG
jgi:exopolyphosphatase/guanosine-5'-triphosphate,3'-diphosphate pyrophosphatase